jgi:hypothetical protein
MTRHGTKYFYLWFVGLFAQYWDGVRGTSRALSEGEGERSGPEENRVRDCRCSCCVFQTWMTFSQKYDPDPDEAVGWGTGDTPVEDCYYFVDGQWQNVSGLLNQGKKVPPEGLGEDEILCPGDTEKKERKGDWQYLARMTESHDPCRTTVIDTPGCMALAGRTSIFEMTLIGKIWDKCRQQYLAEEETKLERTIRLDRVGTVMKGEGHVRPPGIGTPLPPTLFESQLHWNHWRAPDPAVSETIHDWVLKEGKKAPEVI